jgi:hypothetical protein
MIFLVVGRNSHPTSPLTPPITCVLCEDWRLSSCPQPRHSCPAAAACPPSAGPPPRFALCFAYECHHTHTDCPFFSFVVCSATTRAALDLWVWCGVRLHFARVSVRAYARGQHNRPLPHTPSNPSARVAILSSTLRAHQRVPPPLALCGQLPSTTSFAAPVCCVAAWSDILCSQSCGGWWCSECGLQGFRELTTRRLVNSRTPPTPPHRIQHGRRSRRSLRAHGR